MPKKFTRSFSYARAGAQHAFKTQRNIWIHLAIGAAVLLAAFWFKVSQVEMALLLLTIAFVMVMELFNTALEEAVNLVKAEDHPLAALAKNVAAGAVLVAAIGAVGVGLIIFWPRLIW